MIKTISLPNFLSFNAPAKTHSRSFSKVAKVKPASAFRFWTVLVLAVLNLLVLMSYVAGVNNNASKGYEIKNLQSKISRLNEENGSLGLKVSEVSSMVAIQTDYLNANFVAVGSAKYLQLNPASVSLK